MINISCEFNSTFESTGILSITEIHVHDVCCLQTRFNVHMDTQIPYNTSESPVGSHRPKWMWGARLRNNRWLSFLTLLLLWTKLLAWSLVEFFSSLFLSLRKHICTPNNTAADGLLGRWWGQIEWWREIWAWTHNLPLSCVNKVSDEFSMTLSTLICKMEMRPLIRTVVIRSGTVS